MDKEEQMDIQLNWIQKSIVRRASFLMIVGWIVAIFGMFGVVLGLYTNYCREMSSDARILNQSLFLYSIGLFFIGGLLSQTCTIIKKLMVKQQEELNRAYNR